MQGLKFVWERSCKQAADEAGISLEELKNKLESGEAHLEISIVIPLQEKNKNED